MRGEQALDDVVEAAFVNVGVGEAHEPLLLRAVEWKQVKAFFAAEALLLNDDIISLGHHRLKVMNVPAPDQAAAGRATAADTRRMKNLDEMRRKRKAQLRVVPSQPWKKSR